MAFVRDIYSHFHGYLPKSKDFFGIKLPPPNTLFYRQLEKLSVFFWMFCIIYFPLVFYPLLLYSLVISFKHLSLEVFLIIISLVTGYFSWVWIFDKETIHQGGRKSRFIQSLPVWKWFNDYFPIRLVKSSEFQLDHSKNYLFCSHPHGLVCLGMFGAFIGEGNVEKKRLLGGFEISGFTFDQTFYFPLVREITLAVGACSVSKKSMNYILSREGGGNVAVIIPGGAKEALDFCPGKYILRLKNRKGFVKVALENGASLVPVFSFGENVTFSQLANEKGSVLRRWQDWVQEKIKIPPILFYGRGIFQSKFGLLPWRTPITVVVGAPIPVEKVKDPSPSQVDKLHEKYVESLTNLFYEFREKYSPDPKDILVIT